MKENNSRPDGDIDWKTLLKNLDDPERKRQAQERVRKFLQEKEAQEKAKGKTKAGRCKAVGDLFGEVRIIAVYC